MGQRAIAAAESWPLVGGAPKHGERRDRNFGRGGRSLTHAQMARQWEISETALKQATALTGEEGDPATAESARRRAAGISRGRAVLAAVGGGLDCDPNSQCSRRRGLAVRVVAREESSLARRFLRRRVARPRPHARPADGTRFADLSQVSKTRRVFETRRSVCGRHVRPSRVGGRSGLRSGARSATAPHRGVLGCPGFQNVSRTG